MVFPSKRDAWITSSIVGASALLLIAIPAPFVHGITLGRSVLSIFSLATVVFSMSLLVNTKYTIDGDELLVRSGPMRWRIDIRTITRLERTGDPTSGPALSLDRVRIEYAKNGKPKEILVSPADKDGFIAALRERNPAISLPA